MPVTLRRYLDLLILAPDPSLKPQHDPRHTSKSSECVGNTPQGFKTKISSLWRPTYLTKRALAIFFLIFAALAIGAQILLLLSKRNNGLSGVNDGLHRALWKYGPTALLTLVASFWTRLECQMKVIAPWIRMTRGFTTARQSLVLDYLSQFQPVSIISAVRNKDYAVAAVTFNSLLIKVLLVLSTSLCSLSPTAVVRSNVTLTLKSEFINSPSGLTSNGSLAYANFASMMRIGTPLPQGTSDKYAYQLIESEFLDTPSTISTTIDGLLGDIECETAALPANTTILDFSWGKYFPIWTNSCSFGILPPILSTTPQHDSYLVGLQEGDCGNSGDIDDKRVAIIIVMVASAGGHNMTIVSSNSFICKPIYQIQRLNFTARGSERLVSAKEKDDSRVLSNVHPWQMMRSQIHETPYISMNTDNSANISNHTVYFDEDGFLAYLLANASGDPPTLSTIFEDQEGAKTIFSNYYQQYTALLAHTSLMQSISAPSEGTVTEVVNRFLGKRYEVKCTRSQY